MSAATVSGGRTQHCKRPEWNLVRLIPAWCLMLFLKLKMLGAGSWWITLMGRSQIRFNLKISASVFCRPISRDGDADGFPYVSWLDPNRNRRIVYLNRNPKYRKLNLNYPDNRFNDNCVLAGVRRRKPFDFSSPSLSGGEFLFCDYLIDPPAELCADAVQMF
jgi:hypothetical protein